MKLNNKGMSLMELLITIVLISLVVVFLFRLLIDLKDERNNNDFAFNNQINRAEAIYTIEKDLNTYSLRAIEDATKSNGNKIKINFIYSIGSASGTSAKTATLDISSTGEKSEEKYFLNYVSADGEKFSWEMKGAVIDNCGSFTYNLKDDYYYFRLNLYAYNKQYHERNNKDLNNTVDDIEISFAGPKGNLDTKYSGLTNSQNGTKKIGNCTNN